MIEICEVGPRDGLQTEATILSIEKRVEIICRLSSLGIKKIECVSFVRDDMMPQMAGAEQIMELLPTVPGVRYAGLVLSASGMNRALFLEKLTEIHVAVAASDAFNEKNVGRTTWDTLTRLSSPIKEALESGKKVRATVATAFGCPYEGKIALKRVLEMIEFYLNLGDCGIALADTTGLANPRQVSQIVREITNRFPGVCLSLHFHNTRGLGLANVLAGIQAGVSRFDSSIGGLGGCPYAPQAVGNVCTEDLVNMCEAMGIETGINLEGLIETAKWVEHQLQHKLDGLVMKAGPIKG
ncbi:hydroxymethylglutaryl-CoA lyase [Aneurinibacillus sp. Ricciae_BoGa-3]|uniref:hydroxymethylglutaryl-CoA lyase n=1 Tax=Aneurinibacillus sp. Ricciae_BoGa-3 TaxID=3022697 RepID=UPI0023407CC6|nr:hydroxymethylglutaryl-CoA lyase [Aneurinibacillus sp. Ricciae_BoGa-3]WCK55258.1 hydroxymethylglutaryl-CoA lyase [Aneurinibacillus sp. Ricciae_BoGa-3]